MPLFCTAVSGGITGGITNGATYLSIVAGSNVPPGMAAQAPAVPADGTKSTAPPTAPALRNCRLVIIRDQPSCGHASEVGELDSVVVLGLVIAPAGEVNGRHPVAAPGVGVGLEPEVVEVGPKRISRPFRLPTRSCGPASGCRPAWWCRVLNTGHRRTS